MIPTVSNGLRKGPYLVRSASRLGSSERCELCGLRSARPPTAKRCSHTSHGRTDEVPVHAIWRPERDNLTCPRPRFRRGFSCTGLSDIVLAELAVLSLFRINWGVAHCDRSLGAWVESHREWAATRGIGSRLRISSCQG